MNTTELPLLASDKTGKTDRRTDRQTDNRTWSNPAIIKIVGFVFLCKNLESALAKDRGAISFSFSLIRTNYKIGQL